MPSAQASSQRDRSVSWERDSCADVAANSQWRNGWRRPSECGSNWSWTEPTELRQAIRDSGMTHYGIANQTGFRAHVKAALTPDHIDRFMSGERDLHLTNVDKVV